MKTFSKSVATAIVTGMLCMGAAAAEDVMVVYDASGSMWGQIDGVTKIEIARDVMGDLVQQWPAETNLGLVAYGHRREADCGDIETVLSPAPISPASFMDAVNAISPLGRTPLSAAVEQAAEELGFRENPATVVLISDGIENCSADPCALASELAGQGIAFTTHVIGFDVNSEEYDQLSCIAENTGGIFVPASDAAELADALDEVQQVIEATPEPEPEPEPELPEVSLSAPDTVTVGTQFLVGWTPALGVSDQIVMFPAGDDTGRPAASMQTGGDVEREMTAPPEPGLYELRYLLAPGLDILATLPIEVVDAPVTLDAPETITIGAEFPVSWDPTLNPLDWITIVPAGADQGAYLDYQRVNENESVTLTAPADPGLYEIRYVLDEGDRTMASVPIEVVDATQTVSGPETVTIGSEFDVTWGETVNRLDWITIVPAGADEGEHLDYQRVNDSDSVTLTAPAEPGLYELRYVLEEDDRTLASAAIEVMEATQSVSGPETVTIGSEFDVTWGETVNRLDWITIVPAGADEGEYLDYQRVNDSDSVTLTAPAEPGLYELRYVLEEDDRTLASAAIEVMEATQSVSGPETVTIGSEFDVTWGETVNRLDWITIVPAGADEGEYLDYQRVNDSDSVTLTAPAEPGLYELRYVLEEDDRTLASAAIEVMEATQTVSGPETVTIGSEFDVTWGETVNRLDWITIVPAGADEGEYLDYQRVNDSDSVTLTAPAEPGLYELRYVLDEDDRTLAYLAVEVVEVEQSIDAPDVVIVDTAFDVTWDESINRLDWVTIVPAGAEEGEYLDYQRVNDNDSVSLTAPAEPGFYEVRYVLEEGGRTLASRPIEVLPEGSPIDSGAGLEAPASAAPGETVEIEWTAAVDGARISLARADQADFTWIEVQSTDGQKSLSFTMPQEPGRYEIRFLDVATRTVLGRSPITVQ